MNRQRRVLTFAFATVLSTFAAALLHGGVAHAQSQDGAGAASDDSQPKKPKKHRVKRTDDDEEDTQDPASAEEARQKEEERKQEEEYSRARPPAGDDGSVWERPGKTYYFLGLRYRGTVVPQFVEGLFLDGGTTFYSNSIGIEADFRKDGFSIIPSLTYEEYGTSDFLAHQKSKPDIPQNWEVVNSSLKGMYGSVDLLWSTKIHPKLDFEYGFGIAIGAIFGDLSTIWVHNDPNGAYKTDDGKHQFSECTVEQPGGCMKSEHSNADTAHLVGYTEPSWANGGSKPNIFGHINLPELGLRFKPAKEFEARLTIGLSIPTGFFFGISGDYGFEKHPKDASAPPAATDPK